MSNNSAKHYLILYEINFSSKRFTFSTLYFLFRISHAYGISISRESTPYRLVGAIGNWIIILVMAIYGIYTYIT